MVAVPEKVLIRAVAPEKTYMPVPEIAEDIVSLFVVAYSVDNDYITFSSIPEDSVDSIES